MIATVTTHSPVFCALDLPDIEQAERAARELAPHIDGLKLGLEFFLANGADGYRRMAACGLPIFLDLKLHDIPNTVAGAVTSLLPLRPAFLTLHASGGADMMVAAAGAAATLGAQRPKLLAVTVLTSIDGDDLAAVGQGSETTEQVLRLAKLAQSSGMDGVICSPAEIAALRRELGPDFILMVPGIRPDWAATQDQKRVLTPKQAMDAGATYLVIGRPIMGADDRAKAAQRIAGELA